jgi:hypothetical protein
MAKITDPDNLNQGVEVTFDTTTKRILLSTAGNLSSDGVAMQAVYSFAKEEWKSDTNLIKFPFPLIAITEQKFDFVNGWNFSGGTTRQLVRDGGWAYKDANNASIEEYMGVITLGSIVDGSQIYYQQNSNSGSTNMVLTGASNQAVQIYNSGVTETTDYRNFFKIFVREYQNLYDQSALAAIGQTQVTYQVYAFPLGNSTDLKISATDNQVDTTSPYSAMSISYLVGSGYTSWASGQTYGLHYVTKDLSDGRWYRSTSAHTSVGTSRTFSQSSVWTSYLGERSIGGSYYAYNVVVSGNTGLKTQVYEFVQRQLRKSTNINSGYLGPAFGNVSGKTADALMNFVGDTLVTEPGVYVDNFAAVDTNSYEFYDLTGNTSVKRIFPFVAAGSISFNENLTGDTAGIYKMYFTTNPSGDFGTSNAILVNNNVGNPITGSTSGVSSVSFDFDYDGNVQGGRVAGTDAEVTIVSIGLTTGQYVRTTGTITRSNANSFSLVSSLERNYSNT